MVWDNDFRGDMKQLKRHMRRFFRDWGFDSNIVDLKDELDDGRDMSDFRKAKMDFYEEDGVYVLEVELPGIEKEDISLNIEDGRIEIKAGKKQEHKEEEKKGYRYSKSFVGFYRVIELPENADCDNVDAKYKNGVLIIKITKKEKDSNKKEVQIR